MTIDVNQIQVLLGNIMLNQDDRRYECNFCSGNGYIFGNWDQEIWEMINPLLEHMRLMHPARYSKIEFEVSKEEVDAAVQSIRKVMP